ncbi:MAG: ABC transporter permease subunit [Deltaproteobacteria bacterium]|nr:ABC transporter permease subunit [Deltaproteobacteria bacterium]
MKARVIDDSSIFGRLAWRSLSVTRTIIAFARRDRRAMVGGILLILYILVALVGPSIAPYDSNSPELAVRMQAPSWAHWLGTDRIGRDVLTRIIAGSQISLQVAAGAVVMALILGAPLGALGSYLGGVVDSLVQRVMDAIMAFPSLVLALALVALAGPSVIMLWFAIAFSSIPRYARLVRSGVLTQKEREYVYAARAMGQSSMRILVRQILPNIMAPIAVQLTLDFARAISVEAALSYLGLGLSVPYISWGTMIRDAQDFLEVAPWLAIFPGLALVGVILAFTLVGDALRDLMDPRMRRSLNTPGQRIGIGHADHPGALGS